jgi:glycosyltransferase involved in cell wall biosynthesis
VLVAHEPFNYGALTLKHRLVAACQRRLFGAMARRCAAVVVTTKARARSVESIVGPACLVRVIGVGATLAGADEPPVPQGSRPGPPFRVATFGRLELGRRRLDVLHDAAARIASPATPVELHLVGPTDAPASRWREGLAPRVGLDVAFHGTVTAEEATQTLAFSHAAVLFDTSALGGISTRSTVAANLLASGVPVISNAGVDTGEPFLDGANVLLCPPEPATLAQRLALLRDDTALREHLARGGRVLFERELAWPVIAGRYLAVLDELQARGPGPRW